TQPETTFRLRGKGIPGLHGRGRGDQYVSVKVQIPTGLSAKQKDARDFPKPCSGSPQDHREDGSDRCL
ncbi:MAG: molecular chaperone DnaJ, partial [Bacteroidales bacterium]|nr:molecular chaperone DnaJ [Bacteroidales bacterium]